MLDLQAEEREPFVLAMEEQIRRRRHLEDLAANRKVRSARLDGRELFAEERAEKGGDRAIDQIGRVSKMAMNVVWYGSPLSHLNMRFWYNWNTI